ncbi:hypothetical protein XELAEV_18008856mg [Xenopus laevis]|uniref:Uncharacterized protein n=1 Tax=Xenopus laevis TaxID=8355 RepID=A0A974DSK3_XENLA|nr:hypothetical protein XELAEV_18008856mg [Xenopus laevis]
MWHCPNIQPYWAQIKQILPRFTDMAINDSASSFMLHHNEMSLAQYKKSVVSTLLTAAKTLIPLFQTSSINEIYQFEQHKMDVSKPNQQEKQTQKWFHWIQNTESPQYDDYDDLKCKTKTVSPMRPLANYLALTSPLPTIRILEYICYRGYLPKKFCISDYCPTLDTGFVHFRMQML